MVMKKKYDVVIVGAGPGGLECAYHLRNSGKSVLLLERNKVIGPKVCGGGLSYHSHGFMKLPPEIFERGFKNIYLKASHVKTTLKRDHEIFWTISRERLGQWQLSRLKNKIEVLTNTRVTEIGKNRVVIDSGEKIEFKYLVGADGSTSIIRRSLGLESHPLIAIEYVVPTKKYKKLELIFSKKLEGAGYFWVFPYKNSFSVGGGCDPTNLSPQKLKSKFNEWLVEEGIDISKGKYSAGAINTDYKGFKFGNVFLVGDAAGMAGRATGGGICQALVAGKAVAKTIIDKNYKPKELEKLLDVKKNEDTLVGVIDHSGPLKDIEWNIFVASAKLGIFGKKIINMV